MIAWSEARPRPIRTMIPGFRPAALLLLAAAACSGGEEQAPQGGSPLTVREDSVVRGFDPADPAASSQARRAGETDSVLEFDAYEQDLGKVYQHHEYRLEFPFTVRGDEPVTVTRITESCGCTDSFIRPDWEEGLQNDDGRAWPLGRPIPAGARGTVVATFRGDRYRNDKRSSITLRSNAANAPVVLEVRAFVRPVFEADPLRVRFGDVLAGPLRRQAAERVVEVTGMEEWEILRWKRMPRGILIAEEGEMRLRDDGTAVRTLRFRVAGDAPRARIQTAAIAETSLGIDLELLVTARVVGAVDYTPDQRLSFGIYDAGSARTRTVRLEAVSTQVTVPDPAVEIAGEAGEVMRTEVVRRSPAVVEVKVQVPEDVPPGSYPGRLTIRFPEESGVGSKEFTLTARIRQPR